MTRNLITAVALMMATYLVYSQVHTFEFVNYDDGPVVFENESFKTGLGWTGIQEAFRAVYLGNWIPVTWLTYHVDYVLYDDIAGGMHVTNLIFHLLNVLLLFGVMIRYTGRYWPSVFCALLFAIHPLHVESVAWVSERKDLVCGFFFLCTLWAYWSYRESGTWWRYAVVLICTALALLAKPMAVTLPCVLLLLDYWPLGGFKEGTVKKRILEKIPLFLVVILISVATIQLQSDGKAMTGMEELSFLLRFQNVLWAYGVYIGQTLFPIHLLPFYPHPGEALGYLKPGLSAVALVLISVWVWRGRALNRHRVTGWAWYLGMLVPVIGFIQVGGQSHADRYMYLPMIGLGMLIFWELDKLKFFEKKFQSGLVVLFVAMISLSVAAYQQSNRWATSETLFEYTLDIDEKNSVALSGLSEYYVGLEDWDSAEPFLKEMLAFHPRYEPSLINYGKLHYAKGNYEEAKRYYNRLLSFQPDNVQALINLGNVLLAQGASDDAEKLYRKAISIDPDISEAYSNLGAVLIASRSFEEAQITIEKGLSLDSNDAVAWVNLGVVHISLGNKEKALEAVQKALEIDPEYDKGRAFLAYLNSLPSE
jgi:tetratricopeptide (TPR) repeat protein